MRKVFRDVVNATVWFPEEKGQGVLVEKGMIITAAHCLPPRWAEKTGHGYHAVIVEDLIYFEFITRGGEDLKCAPMVVDPVADVAVLNVKDRSRYPWIEKSYRKWCRRTRPVRLFRGRFSKFPARFRVHILQHNGSWVIGKATVFRDRQNAVYVETRDKIECGTSGGPIITDDGDLVSVSSWVTTVWSEQQRDGGVHPMLRRVLPAWILEDLKIRAS